MKRYGLLGRTLTHSFSSAYFANKFREQNLSDCVYQNFELPEIDALPQLLKQHSDLCGLNVTIPYKEQVLPFLTMRTEVVESIGACNCIKIEEGNLLGFNTDAIGFERSLIPHLQSHYKNALVLGTGGAAKAICYTLQKLQIDFKTVSRKSVEGGYTYDELNKEILNANTLLVNTTPLGTFPAIDEAPPIPYQFLTPAHLLFDLVYNPAKTKFLSEGESRGARIVNGYQMLIEQAEESWRIWNA